MKKLISVLLLLLAVILTLSACDLDDLKVTTTTTTTTTITKTGTTTAPADPVDPSDPTDPTDPSDHSKHTSSGWIIDKEATCTENGSKHKECTVCHETLETATIKTTGHNYKNGKCAECGKEQRDSEGLEFGLSEGDDGGAYYIVTGIGTCTDKDIIIPSKYNGLPVEGIDSGAFYGCTELTSVTIPDSVVWIAFGNYYSDGAFEGCTSLKSVTIGSSVEIIGDYAFKGCSNLKSVTIGNGIEYIGSYAFSDCKKLTSVTIPDSIECIGDCAFNGCSNLKSVTIGSGIEYIGYHAFSDCDSLKYNKYDTALYLGNADNPYLVLIEANEYHTIFGYNHITSCIINENTKIICNYAFNYCTELTSVTIGNSVEYIGSYAFYDCTGLSSVTIPDSVTYIDYYAFSYCSGLKSITVDKGNTVYHSKDNCIIETSTNALILGCKNSIIPDYVTSIYCAFEGCESLASITIPNSVKEILFYSFGGCSGLKTINYTGTKNQWEAITKSDDWDYDTGDYTINYNYKGN